MRPRLKTLAASALVVAAVLIAYLPSIGGGFLWNDSDYVTGATLRSGRGLGRIWFEVGATQQYYPLLHSAFWLEYRLWGDAPAGYHLASIVLHAISACLLGLTLRRLAIPGAWLAAAIFALHPVGVESVAWISEQKNTLSTVFFLAAALAYLNWVGTGGPARPGRLERRTELTDRRDACPHLASSIRPDGTDARPHLYLLATVLFILAILSKTTTVVLPGALLVVLWWRQGKLAWRRDVRPLLPWFALGAAAGLFSSWVERKYLGAEGAEFALGALPRVLVAGRAVWFYLGKLFWPVHLTFIYPKWEPNPAAPAPWLFPLGLLALAGVFAAIRRRTRAPLAALLFFVGSLFPVLGFFNFYGSLYSFVADHWQYLPSLGIIALAAAGLALGAARLPPRGRRLAPVFGAGLLGLLGILTWRQCRMYRDDATLYRITLERNPDCWMAHYNWGTELAAAGDLSPAIDHFEQALRIRPGYYDACVNLGAALFRAGRLGEALDRGWEAFRLRPASAQAQGNLGFLLAHTGRLPEAQSHLEEAVRLDPGYATARFDLGNVLAREGRPSSALEQYEGAIRLHPDYPQAELNAANLYLQMGRRGDAFAAYGRVLRRAPGFAEAHIDFGLALAREGNPAEAVAQYQAALRLDPGSAPAQFDWGNALGQEGRLDEAIPHFREALRLDPSLAAAHNNLGNALAQSGHLPEAVEEYQAALRLVPGYSDARANLARARKRIGEAP